LHPFAQTDSMNKKGDAPKQTIGDTMEKISDHVDSLNDQIKPITRRMSEAMKSSRNPHVEELTIGRTAYVKGMKVTYTREQAHRQQFLVRRMWAITLLANMRREGFTWDGIRTLTGKTRQTWDNVTQSGFVPYDIAHMNFRSHETEQSTRDRRDARDKAIKDAEYRPVTNGFIRNVCENIEAEGYTVWTRYFRNNFDMGLTVWNNKPTKYPDMEHLPLIQERIGNGRGWAILNEMSFENGKVITAVESVEPIVIEGERKNSVEMNFVWTRKEEFPLLDVHDVQLGEHNCWEYHMDIELTVYGYANEKTEEPDPRATTAFEFWKHTQQRHPEEDDGPRYPEPTNPDKFRDTEEARDKKVLKDLEEKERAAGIDPGDPPTWTKVPTEPTPKAIERPEAVIKADDGKPLNADIGGFHIFHKPIELLPQMADENGQIKLTVVVQMDDDGKKPKGVIATDNKGWFHWS